MSNLQSGSVMMVQLEVRDGVWGMGDGITKKHSECEAEMEEKQVDTTHSVFSSEGQVDTIHSVFSSEGSDSLN